MCNNIKEKIKEIVCNKFNSTDKVISDNTSFRKDLEADSLDIIELIMDIEEFFKIEILDEDIEKLDDISSIVNYIKKNDNENVS